MSATTRNVRINRLIANTFIGTSVGIYASWNYSQRGAVYKFLNDLPTISPQPLMLPEPSKVRQILERDFVFDSRHPERPQTWLLCALSHKDLAHCAFNLITFSSFATVITSLPTWHFSAILLGSGLASSAAFLFDERRNKTNGRGIGASGVVSGVLTTVTMFIPRLPTRIFFILPMPLWVATAGYFVVDSYMMANSSGSRIGHSAHIGGGLFGVAYYLLFLRRFGPGLARF